MLKLFLLTEYKYNYKFFNQTLTECVYVYKKKRFFVCVLFFILSFSFSCCYEPSKTSAQM